jgi:hypothetical protein
LGFVKWVNLCRTTAGCPLLTANSTLMELSIEQEALEDAGYEVGLYKL